MRIRGNRCRICVIAVVVMLLISYAASGEQLSEENTASVQTAITLCETDMEANRNTIRILLERCMESLPEGDPAAATLGSVITLLDIGASDAVSVTTLLRNLVDRQESESFDVTSSEVDAAGSMGSKGDMEDTKLEEIGKDSSELEGGVLGDLSGWVSPAADYGLPVYEAKSLIRSIFRDQVLVKVPGDWGSNESGRSLTSYSPVNRSGAISPKAGTLTFSYFECESLSPQDALEDYENNISRMSVTTGMISEDITTTDLPARRLDFTMSVGANRFLCETVCFAYDRTVYTIELMQGMQSSYDYFPMYQDVVASAEVGDAQAVADAMQESGTHLEVDPEKAAESEDQPEGAVEQEVQSERGAELENQSESGQSDVQPECILDNAGDIGSFRYLLNGHEYQFPTAVSEIAPEDLQLNRDMVIPYDFNSDADMTEGKWTEIVNTQYYSFENSLYKEMAGVTNMSGYPVPVTGGILTALIDTQGDYVDIELPGNIKVGSPESSIMNGFPDFSGVRLDGLAHFRGNELLYAANVRDDGCNGYVLIRNDAPYYSAVSIICDGGVVREISYECIGSARAEGVFL